MLKRYQLWTEAHPRLEWLLTVVLGLLVALPLSLTVPGVGSRSRSAHFSV